MENKYEALYLRGREENKVQTRVCKEQKSNIRSLDLRSVYIRGSLTQRPDFGKCQSSIYFNCDI